MKKPDLFWIAALAVLAVFADRFYPSLFAAEVAIAKLPPPAARPIDFAKDIQPIFADHCYVCHGPHKQESALRLDQKERALKGGETFGAAAIVPGKSAASVLVQAVAHTHPDLAMPKKGDALTAEQVGLLRAWIDQGAVWPAANAAQGRDLKAQWAFKAPVKPKLPRVQDQKWARTPVDNFVLA